jgi:protease stability complex PrcB-like protein
MMLLAFTLAAALVQPPPAAGAAQPATTAPTMKTIDKGEHSNMDDAAQVVAKTAQEWQRLWQKHAPDRPRPAAVDFSKEMVLGVFLGSRPTAGYMVEIASATQSNGTLVVRYRESAPPRGAITAQVLTSPYHLVTVPFFPGDVKFEKEPAR